MEAASTLRRLDSIVFSLSITRSAVDDGDDSSTSTTEEEESNLVLTVRFNETRRMLSESPNGSRILTKIVDRLPVESSKTISLADCDSLFPDGLCKDALVAFSLLRDEDMEDYFDFLISNAALKEANSQIDHRSIYLMAEFDVVTEVLALCKNSRVTEDEFKGQRTRIEMAGNFYSTPQESEVEGSQSSDDQQKEEDGILTGNVVDEPAREPEKTLEEKPADEPEPAPVEEPVADELAHIEEPAADEPAKVEETAADERAKVEEQAADERAKVEEPAADEPADVEEPTADEPAPEDCCSTLVSSAQPSEAKSALEICFNSLRVGLLPSVFRSLISRAEKPTPPTSTVVVHEPSPEKQLPEICSDDSLITGFQKSKEVSNSIPSTPPDEPMQTIGRLLAIANLEREKELRRKIEHDLGASQSKFVRDLRRLEELVIDSIYIEPDDQEDDGRSSEEYMSCTESIKEISGERSDEKVEANLAMIWYGGKKMKKKKKSTTIKRAFSALKKRAKKLVKPSSSLKKVAGKNNPEGALVLLKKNTSRMSITKAPRASNNPNRKFLSCF